MKRVLILANNSGGLYRFRKELIETLKSLDNEIIASTPFDENIKDLTKIGINLIETKINRRGMNPIKDFKLLLSYFRIIKKIKPDLIITYTIKPNLYGGTISRIFKIPVAINITGLGSVFQNDNFIKKMVIHWYKFVCKNAKVVFFENIGNMKVFVESKILKESKCCILNGAGVNLEDFPFTDYPQDEHITRFLFIGRIMKEKGIDELLWAIERLHCEYSNVVLDVVGNYEDDYQKKIEELVHKEIINYYGFQKDVKPFIEKCNCFVLPSYHEGMANTLLECAAMGRPLITSNIHGCLEAVDDSINGFLVNVKDKEALYEGMKKFIVLKLDQKKEMGLKSRQYIAEKFDKRKVVEKSVKRIL